MVILIIQSLTMLNCMLPLCYSIEWPDTCSFVTQRLYAIQQWNLLMPNLSLNRLNIKGAFLQVPNQTF